MSKSTRGIRAAGVASLAVSLSIGVAAPAFAVAGFSFERIGGDDRYATATLVADEYGNKPDAILANGQPGFYADALSSNYLSKIKDAPILLTRIKELPQSTLDQLDQMNAQRVTVVGGEGVVPQEQVDQLTAAGYTVTRISGDDRFGTNAEVIGEGGAAAGGIGLIATGFNFPDALAAGPFAYQGHPLGLTTQNDVPDSVGDALEADGVKEVLIFGGTDVVGAGVVSDLAARGITVKQRFAGADRSETSELAAEWALANLGFTNKHVGVASGYTEGYGADALAGGPLEGKEKSPMLITRNVDNPDDVNDYLTKHSNTLVDGHLFGGPAAVSAAAEAAMEKAAQGDGANQTYSATGTSGTAATNTVSAGSPNENRGARTYTFNTGSATVVDIALIPAEEVTVSEGGAVTFGDNEGNANQADDLGNTDAVIESVNGVDVADSDYQNNVTPSSGAVSFTVDSETANESVIPVVFTDANTNDALDLDATDKPTEAFGIGGKKTWVLAEAASGAIDGTVASVDKAADRFSTEDGTYFYDANDVYQLGAGCVQVTQAVWEAALSTNDTVTGSYNGDPQFASTFCLADVSPSAPQNVATSETGGTVTITWDDPASGEPDSYNIYRAVDTNDSEADAGSCPAADSASYTLLKSVAGTANSTTDAPTTADTYCYRVSAVDEGDESPKSDAADETVPQPAETTRPTITDARVTLDLGLQDVATAGDQFRLTFSEDMNASAENGEFVLADADGDRFIVDCETNATCALSADASSNPDRVLTVTITTSPTDDNAGTGDGVMEWPATITTTDADVADEAGNVVSLAGSSDVLIDKEA